MEIETANELFAQPDKKIVEAWERRKAAYVIYTSLPFGAPDQPCDMTPEEKAQWDIVDQAEEAILSTPATSPRGVEIKLWTALCCLTDREDGEAVVRCDTDFLLARGDDLDWPHRLVLSAIKSLQTMEA